MTDRELLELAAKAAKIFSLETRVQDPTPHYWDPLNDDGDALRLAVKLRLKVMCRTAQVEVVNETGEVRVIEAHYRDPDAATRRAIVRAAAEIGKQK